MVFVSAVALLSTYRDARARTHAAPAACVHTVASILRHETNLHTVRSGELDHRNPLLAFQAHSASVVYLSTVIVIVPQRHALRIKVQCDADAVARLGQAPASQVGDVATTAGIAGAPVDVEEIRLATLVVQCVSNVCIRRRNADHERRALVQDVLPNDSATAREDEGRECIAPAAARHHCHAIALLQLDPGTQLGAIKHEIAPTESHDHQRRTAGLQHLARRGIRRFLAFAGQQNACQIVASQSRQFFLERTHSFRRLGGQGKPSIQAHVTDPDHVLAARLCW
mmetsp:Transcript_23422/g.75402  ORF Transcript_23422/g.75402 Transcript_23422/m.75402 type:complete len:283 (-) Transcript_23422:120-968(-)